MAGSSRIGRVALRFAQAHIGVAETPPGSNDGRLIREWQHLAVAREGKDPWCGCFVYAMCLRAHSFAAARVRFPAAVLSWVEAGRRYGWTRLRPYRGDVACYSWDGPDPSPDDHMGFVERVLALPGSHRPLALRGKWWIRTVEGNTGEAVRRRWRWVDPRTVVFLRLPD